MKIQDSRIPNPIIPAKHPNSDDDDDDDVEKLDQNRAMVKFRGYCAGVHIESFRLVEFELETMEFRCILGISKISVDRDESLIFRDYLWYFHDDG